MDMNNEPVAWGWYDLEIKRFFPHWDEDLMETKEGCIPLYTHPAKESDSTKIASEKEFWECYSKVCSENHPAKTLTDEEILSCWFEHGQMLTIQQARVQFARAILRKAQEK